MYFRHVYSHEPVEKKRIKISVSKMTTDSFVIESDRRISGWIANLRRHGRERRRKQPSADGICFRAKISLPPHLPKAERLKTDRRVFVGGIE